MIKKLHEKLINQEITAEEMTKQYLIQIKEREPEIHAYLTITEDEALEQARFVDMKIKNGEKIDLLAGIPGSIKDVLCTKNIRTTAGSRILDNYIAPYDATVIKKLKTNNAVILGKTNCDEFAMGSSTENSGYGPTSNPIDLTRVPGGSSGGSAAAVASDECVWSLGTDTGGSIRQPAAFCGIVGIKPTYGRVSRYGTIAMASSLDQIGPLAKTVEDAAIVLSAISGQDKMDATSAHSADKKYESYTREDMTGFTIGVPKEYFAEGINSDVADVNRKAIEKCKDLGAKIETISMPHSMYALATYYIIMSAEVSSNMARFDGIKYGMRADDHEHSGGTSESLLDVYLDSRHYGLGSEVKRRIMLGTYTLSAGYYDAYYKKAQKVRRLIKKDFEDAFQSVDLIFSPTTPDVAFKIGEKAEDPLAMYLADIYTITANLAGIPAISLPVGEVMRDGIELPVGAQFFGKWFDEEGIIGAASALERAQK